MCWLLIVFYGVLVSIILFCVMFLCVKVVVVWVIMKVLKENFVNRSWFMYVCW